MKQVAMALLRTIRRWRARNRALYELRMLPDWRLAQIGVPRDRIPELVDVLLAKAAAPARPSATVEILPAPVEPEPSPVSPLDRAA